MNIYELEKQATTGPFVRADKEYYTAEPHSLVKASDADRKIAELYTENDADDIMFAHCRNNFMRALDALKRLNETAISDILSETDDIIAELEEVKV